MTYKQAGEKELHIDAPIDLEIVTDATHEDGSAAMDEKYYNIISSKDLYGTYQALYERGMIKPICQTYKANDRN